MEKPRHHPVRGSQTLGSRFEARRDPVTKDADAKVSINSKNEIKTSAKSNNVIKNVKNVQFYDKATVVSSKSQKVYSNVFFSLSEMASALDSVDIKEKENEMEKFLKDEGVTIDDIAQFPELAENTSPKKLKRKCTLKPIKKVKSVSIRKLSLGKAMAKCCYYNEGMICNVYFDRS